MSGQLKNDNDYNNESEMKPMELENIELDNFTYNNFFCLCNLHSYRIFPSMLVVQGYNFCFKCFCCIILFH